MPERFLMKDQYPHPDYQPPLTPLISAIVSEFQERHDLAEVIGLHARLSEVCGGDTLLKIVCDETGCHLHVTTFRACGLPN